MSGEMRRQQRNEMTMLSFSANKSQVQVLEGPDFARKVKNEEESMERHRQVFCDNVAWAFITR